jgi:hypothetical protein
MGRFDLQTGRSYRSAGLSIDPTARSIEPAGHSIDPAARSV